MLADKRPVKVFLCHARADRDPVRGLYAHLTRDGVDGFAWLNKEKPCVERSAALSLSKCRNILPPVPAPQVQAGQDWELEIRKAVRAFFFSCIIWA